MRRLDAPLPEKIPCLVPISGEPGDSGYDLGPVGRGTIAVTPRVPNDSQAEFWGRPRIVIRADFVRF